MYTKPFSHQFFQLSTNDYTILAVKSRHLYKLYHSTSCYYDYDVLLHTTSCLMQRSTDEVCELITDKYNPVYIPSNSVGATVICDDDRGKHTGTYQCLGRYWISMEE